MTAFTSGVVYCSADDGGEAKVENKAEATKVENIAVVEGPKEEIKAEKPKGKPLGLIDNIVCAGGAAVITVSFIHPIDVVKTRL